LKDSQRWILVCGACLAALALFVPPWQFRVEPTDYSPQRMEIPLGYHILFLPPKGEGGLVRIDSLRLALEMGVLAFATLAAVLVVRAPRPGTGS